MQTVLIVGVDFFPSYVVFQAQTQASRYQLLSSRLGARARMGLFPFKARHRFALRSWISVRFYFQVGQLVSVSR